MGFSVGSRSSSRSPLFPEEEELDAGSWIGRLDPFMGRSSGTD